MCEGYKGKKKEGRGKTKQILLMWAGSLKFSTPSAWISELQGRFHLRVESQPWGQEELYKIWTEPDNALQKQYSALLATENVEINFTECGLKAISSFAEEVNTRTENIGARRLYTIMEKLLADISFEAPERAGEKIEINAEYVSAHLEELQSNDDLTRFIL